MENLIFFSLIFALFINFATGAISFSGVNRTFHNIYRGLIESSVSFMDEAGRPMEGHFDKEALEYYLISYFDENLTRYVTHYKTAIYYFDKDDQVVCTSQNCQAVRISLDCEINYFFHYTKARNFYINENYE